ncbi:L-seryl-tRNA(Sec) selenium transferase [SAR202 cluster bacterium AC-409-J13_OGT_754m]|nr:L-seryl-tRNA(Sec) selenium transferase [SAR202 cluster bacterium AC-409-J13_OGT_754m]
MKFRELPSVDKILLNNDIKPLLEQYSRAWVTSIIRVVLQAARLDISNGSEPLTLDQIVQLVYEKCIELVCVRPMKVINTTGVIIHTNLGRSPLSQDALDAMESSGKGYGDLEFDIKEGKRGSRDTYILDLLKYLTGAESGLIVNNNAAAMLLGLTVFAQGKNVVISRSESVEIGGGFRVPDVIEQSGVRIKEVGTTNRTFIKDYENAIDEQTVAIVKIHPSNFKVMGFTASPDLPELVEFAHKRELLVMHDIGSGCLLDVTRFGLAYEPLPIDSVKAGVDLVFFSGDKLLGGPQAGIIVGKKSLINRMASHPMARALRMDKTRLAALHATLNHYIKGDVLEKIPIWRMITATSIDIKNRAIRWKNIIGDVATVKSAYSTIGGGSLPGETLETWVVAINCSGFKGGAEAMSCLLRRQDPPILARIEQEQILLDPRTVDKHEEDTLISVIKDVING